MSATINQSFDSQEPFLRQAQGLKRLAQIINAYPSQQQALNEALKVVAEVLQVEKCLLMRFDARANRLIPLIPAYGFSNEELNGLQVALPRSGKEVDTPENECRVFTTAFQQAIPLFSNQPHTFYNISGNNLTVRNAVVVPVLIEGRTQGVCAALDGNAGTFNEQDAETLGTLAGMMSTLLKNLGLINQLEVEKRRHLAVLDAAVDGFVEVGRDFRITVFSKGAESMTGWKAEEALGRTCSEVLLPHSPNAGLLCHSCPLNRAFRYGASIPNVETLIRTRDGEDSWVSCSYNVVTDEQGGLVSGVIAIKDIYRIKALSDELRQQIQQQESLLGVINAINGISSIEEIYSKALGEVANAIDFDLGMIHAIREGQDLELMAIYEPGPQTTTFVEPVSVGPALHFDSEDDMTLRNPIAELELELREDEDLRRFERTSRHRRSESNKPVMSGRNYKKRHLHKQLHNCEALRQNEPYMAVNLPGKEVCGVLEDFNDVQSHLCVPIKTQEKTFGVLHLASHRPYAFWGSDFALALSICKQIAVAAERASLFEQVDLLARTDPLTKLYNKREFWDRIERELKRAERQRRPLSLMLIDLDRLKWYNDYYGHSHGDTLLAHIGQLIRDKCRNTDIAFRYGGDELCLLLPDTSTRDALVVAERIRTSAIELQVMIGDEVEIGNETENVVTMSIGIASFPNDATGAGELFENADAAMYRAKENGKNRSIVFDNQLDLKRRRTARRTRSEDYVDDRLHPPQPNPPLLSGGQQMTLPFNPGTGDLRPFAKTNRDETIVDATYTYTPRHLNIPNEEGKSDRAND